MSESNTAKRGRRAGAAMSRRKALALASLPLAVGTERGRLPAGHSPVDWTDGARHRDYPLDYPKKGDTWRTEGTSVVPGRLLVFDGTHWRVAEEERPSWAQPSTSAS